MSVDSLKMREGANLLAARKWVAAGQAYRAGCSDADVGTLSLDDQLRRNLALNMADLATHRPKLVKVLESSPTDPRFDLETTTSGRMTISLNKAKLGGEDPLAALAKVMEQLKTSRANGDPIAVVGSGDGYLLVALARHPLPLFLGREQCVHFFEHNPGLLLLCMMIHDLSGETGPIRQQRFQWWVGHDCVGQYREALLNEPGLPGVTLTVTTPPDGARLGKEIVTVADEAGALDAILTKHVARAYADEPVERFIEALGTNPPRRPRALLLTTRFSTVLQYSTADSAEALRELGWDVEVLIERTPYHMITLPMVRQSILRVQPDVIFQIDHSRAEHGTLFPGNVPFACWAQDHLPNLTDPAAGRKYGKRDFLLTNLGPWYHREYAYPIEQVVPLGKLTKLPPLPDAWESDGPDLTYVSNASKLPARALEELVQFFTPYPDTANLGAIAGTLLMEKYAAGQSFAGSTQMHAVIAEAAAKLGRPVASFVGIPELATELLERVNNLCYRQQALTWVADAADEMDLKLEIYGAGWEKHPRLARYAKGHVKYGSDLENLTRRTKINLQIVPYSCLHQRLLDGIAAGGFFLVRSHVSDTSILRMSRFADAHLPADVETVEAARRVLPAELLPEFEALAHENAFIADRVDAVELCRICQRIGLFRGGAEMPPRIGEVSFGSAAQLRERLAQYLGAPERRREIAKAQYAAISRTLSYRAGMQVVIEAIRDRLATEVQIQVPAKEAA